MAVYQIDKILEDVRISLDMNSSSDMLAQINDTDTLSLNEIIKSKIIEGVKMVHCSAPIHLLDEWEDFGNNLYWGELECGHVLLPDDFMRLVSFRMSDWNRAVYNAITPDNPEYQKQSSRFKGIRGNCQNPVCAITVRPEGKTLEFYSCRSNSASISEALYLPYPAVEKDQIRICQKCYKGTVYTIAALVSATLGNTDMCNMFNELSKSSLI